MSLYTAGILLTVVIGLVLGNRAIKKLVNRVGAERHIDESRIDYVIKSIQLVWVFIGVVAGIALTGSSVEDVGVLVGSSLAFLGVALFAQWSLLSNATASIIVFFFFPYRVGSWVEIIDGDNTVIGQIKEITLFHVIMLDEDNAIVTYPNSLVFQKAVRITHNKPVKKDIEDEINK
ncbi:mechanosensitive ion channel domain-containing protein [Microbulbifer epialgicus]|uniref:Small-conductance mechanosensitive channel n=1 Tax=Microbulbifer epialgicus TaxID=393907 RepID=A0ABV4P4U5_9GAMM